MFHQGTSGFQSYVSTDAKAPFQLRARTITWCIFLFVVGGVIGNRSDAVLVHLWNSIANSVTAGQWSWIITGGV